MNVLLKTVDGLESLSQTLIELESARAAFCCRTVESVNSLNERVVYGALDTQEYLENMTAADWQELTLRVIRAYLMAIAFVMFVTFHTALLACAVAQFIWERRQQIRETATTAARTVNGVSSAHRKAYGMKRGYSLIEWVRTVLFRVIRCAPRQAMRFAQWFWVGV